MFKAKSRVLHDLLYGEDRLVFMLFYLEAVVVAKEQASLEVGWAGRNPAYAVTHRFALSQMMSRAHHYKDAHL